MRFGFLFYEDNVWDRDLETLLHMVRFLHLWIITMLYYMVVTLFLKFLNFAKLLCHFCPILTSPSKIGQTQEHPR